MTADAAPAPTRLLVVRHGQTDWNLQRRLQGHTDTPLNGTGLDQAARLAQALCAEPLAAVYSSDLRRARDTAAAIARATGAPLATHADLRERNFGRFEGLVFSDIEQGWPDAAAQWRRRDPDFTPVGGECLHDFHARCVAIARDLAARHAGQMIVLVAHGGVLSCLYRAALRLPLDTPRSWTVGNASINRLLCTPGGLTLVGWNDDTHLAPAAV